MKNHSRFLLVLLFILLLISPVYAQDDDDPIFIDSDGDGVGDAFDDCPNVPGTSENGCLEQIPLNPDTDGDGVTDDLDNCPNVAGTTADGCLEFAPQNQDTDGDGVTDDLDNCPNVAGTTADGCLEAVPQPQDSDGDGVNDNLDNCPNVAGTAADGCPPPAPDTDQGNGGQQSSTVPSVGTGNAEYRLEYTSNGATLILLNGSVPSLYGISFSNSSAGWDVRDFDFEQSYFQVGDCLQLTDFNATRPAPPAECANVEAWYATGVSSNFFWKQPFAVFYNGVQVAECPAAPGTCSFRTDGTSTSGGSSPFDRASEATTMGNLDDISLNNCSLAGLPQPRLALGEFGEITGLDDFPIFEEPDFNTEQVNTASIGDTFFVTDGPYCNEIDGDVYTWFYGVDPTNDVAGWYAESFAGDYLVDPVDNTGFAILERLEFDEELGLYRVLVSNQEFGAGAELNIGVATDVDPVVEYADQNNNLIGTGSALDATLEAAQTLSFYGESENPGVLYIYGNDPNGRNSGMSPFGNLGDDDNQMPDSNSPFSSDS